MLVTGGKIGCCQWVNTILTGLPRIAQTTPVCLHTTECCHILNVAPKVIYGMRGGKEKNGRIILRGHWVSLALWNPIDVMMVIKAKHLGCGEGYAQRGHVWRASAGRPRTKGAFVHRGMCAGGWSRPRREPHI